MKIHVTTGKRYKATISLGFFEKLASNDTIKQKLLDAGLTDVTVTGSGGSRTAVGTSTYTGEVDLPSQIVYVEEIQ